jgi:hypothetical protein
MGKTRKYKKQRKKKHQRTRKQQGGLCCQYEKSSSGCEGDFRHGEFISRVSPVGEEKTFYGIQFEPRWFATKEGPLPYFATLDDVKIGITYHSFKHMENLGIKCYDESTFVVIIKTMLPKLIWTRNVGNANEKTIEIFDDMPNFKSNFYDKLGDGHNCIAKKNTENCLYYSPDQQKADVTSCVGYYVFETPQATRFKRGKSDSPYYEADGTFNDFTIAAVKLTFIRFLNKNQGKRSPKNHDRKFIGHKLLEDYENTLFLYKIEILNVENWKRQKNAIFHSYYDEKVQQLLLNNVSDCNKMGKVLPHSAYLRPDANKKKILAENPSKTRTQSPCF